MLRQQRNLSLLEKLQYAIWPAINRRVKMTASLQTFQMRTECIVNLFNKSYLKNNEEVFVEATNSPRNRTGLNIRATQLIKQRYGPHMNKHAHRHDFDTVIAFYEAILLVYSTIYYCLRLYQRKQG